MKVNHTIFVKRKGFSHAVKRFLHPSVPIDLLKSILRLKVLNINRLSDLFINKMKDILPQVSINKEEINIATPYTYQWTLGNDIIELNNSGRLDGFWEIKVKQLPMFQSNADFWYLQGVRTQTFIL